jgi:DMSO reductase iron-sulfur subunit
MPQYGFFIDLSRCTGCNACVIACKQWHDIPPGPVKWMRVYQWEKGAFPYIDLRVLPINCFHCENPLCAEACPNTAINKDEKYGAVLVDPDKCTGERKCFEACSYGSPQFASDDPDTKMSKCNMCIDRLERGLSPICVLSCSLRALEFGPIDELKKKYGNIANIETIPEDYSPCRIACPAGFRPEDYVKLIAEGKFHEAIEQFRDSTPFVGVLGRICTRPCEEDCRRGSFDDAVAIQALKRFISDHELATGRGKANPFYITKESKVAVVGSGPAGLTCAYDLTRMGYPVTVFESAAEIGGLMRYGVPEYRLPRKVLNNEIDYIKEAGVEIRTESHVKKVDDLFNQGYKAVFIATGAWKATGLGLLGEDAEGVLSGLELLKKVNTGQKVILGKRVIVIGGGSVAIDSARTALRLGAQEVHVICPECRDPISRDKMPAPEQEISEAEDEGVIVHPCLGISKMVVNYGKVAGLETVKCISVWDPDGSFSPKYAEEDIVIEADNIVFATGQTVGRSFMPAGLDYSATGRLTVDPVTLQTKLKGVFAGGDVIQESGNVITAIAAGKEAAISIDRYLDGKELKDGRRSPIIRKALHGLKSLCPPMLDLKERKGFSEVMLGFDESTAVEQANRCVNCGITVPAVLFKPVDPKRQIIPWEAKKALELWQKRHPDSGEPLPDIFEDMQDIMEVPEGTYGRGKLVLKPKTTEELLFYTTDDE